MGASIPSAVLVLLMMTPPSVALESSSPTMLTTILSNFVPTYTSYNQSCGGNASVDRAPSYISSSGSIGLSINATANRVPHNCYTIYGSEAAASITLTGPIFGVAASGAYVVRTDWNLSWQMAIWGAPGTYSNYGPVEAGAIVYITVLLVDRTTGQWSDSPATSAVTRCQTYFEVGGSASYDHRSCIGGGTPVNRSFQRDLSLPLLVPLSLGDSYQLRVFLYGQVSAVVSNSSFVAHAALTIGGNRHPAQFEDARLTRVS